MSLERVANRRKKIERPEPEPEPEKRDPIGTAAVVPEDKSEGIKKLVDAMNTGSGAQKFSMNEVLSMDSENKSMPEVLAIPIGGLEHDMYRMLERTRLTNYQKGLYCDGIHQAQHGFGWKQEFPNGET